MLYFIRVSLIMVHLHGKGVMKLPAGPKQQQGSGSRSRELPAPGRAQPCGGLVPEDSEFPESASSWGRSMFQPLVAEGGTWTDTLYRIELDIY